MNQRYFLFLLLASFSFPNLSRADLFGSDDFNDGIRDSQKWLLPDNSNWGGQFTESNSALQFTSPGGGGWVDAKWFSPLPASSDWTASCDVSINNLPATYRSWWRLWITSTAPNQPDRFWIALQQYGGVAYDCRAWIDGSDVVVTNVSPASLRSTLRLTYVGRDNLLYAEYREFGATDFTVLSTFDTARWSASAFTVKLEAYSDGPVAAGEMTADNFQIAPLPTGPPGPPEIVQTPSSRTLLSGSSTDFRVSVGGNPSSYQWLQDGKPLVGATNSLLRLTNLRTNQSGVYSVVASNAFGAVSTRGALLTVLPPFRVTRYSVGEQLEQGSLNPIQDWLEVKGIPVDIVADLSRPISISNQVLLIPFLVADVPIGLGQDYAANIQDFVRRGGLLITMGGTPSFLNRVFGFSLLASSDDRATYNRTDQGLVTPFEYGPATLSNPVYPPEQVRPTSAMGLFSSTLPIGSRQIYRDEARDLSFLTLFPYGQGNIIVMDWDSYFVYPFSGGDGGWYETFDLALAVRLGLRPIAPRITHDLDDQFPLEASDLTLSVGVIGSNPLKAQWFKNGQALPGATNSPLTLLSVSSKDSGAYMLRVVTGGGVVTSRVARIEVRPTKGRVGILPNPYATNLASSIESAGFTPLIITRMADYDLSSLDLLMINNWDLFSFPDVQSRAAEIREWAANGGKLILHGSASFLADHLRFAPGCDQMTFLPSPDNLVVDGPYGHLPPDLPPGSWHYYDTIEATSVPARALPILGVGCGTNLLAFSYGLDLGSVYYCSIDFPSSLAWDQSGVYANQYIPNLLEHARHFSATGAPILLNETTNVSMLATRPLRLLAAANGTGPFSFQWYHDGVMIPGATNAPFHIENVNTNHSGHYSVSVSSSFGAITQELAALVVVDPLPFRILALTSSDTQALNDGLSGAPHGGLAISSNQVYYAGSTATLRFPAFPLSAGTTGPQYYSIVSDLRTEKIYTLGTSSNNAAANPRDVITSLLEIDNNGSITSNRIDLSTPLQLDYFTGLFAGNGAVVLTIREAVYRIDLPSGQVTGLGTVPSFSPNRCGDAIYSGIAEAFSNSVYLVYVNDQRSIVRTDVTIGTTTTLVPFPERDMCSFTVSPRLGRWFFHFHGSANTPDILGSSFALFDSPPRLLTVLTNRTIREDSSTAPINFNIQDLDTPAQKLLLSAHASNPDLLPASGLVLGGTGFGRTLTLTPAANQFGTSVVTITITDALGQQTNSSFVLTVTPVDDPPSFSPGPDIVILEDAGPFTFANWATDISTGPPNERDQTLSFICTNDNPNLFSSPPGINSEGNLSFTVRTNISGRARVTVYLQDSGGTVDGGVDTSLFRTFTVTVKPVNDAPAFLAGPDISVSEDAGPQVIPGWASYISPGAADETDQTWMFIVETTNPNLFTSLPAITPDGTLSFTAARNSNGLAVVRVILRDSGGTVDGGSDSSPVQIFTITITPVNDPPIAFARSYSVLEDIPLPITLRAIDIDGDALTFKLRSLPKHGKLTGTAPDLLYLPETNFFGADIFTFVASDPLSDSAETSITIDVTPVNDPPVAIIVFFPRVKLLPDSPREVVISLNNTNALVVLDGLGSYDVDHDPLRYTWRDRDRNIIMATSAVVTNAFGVGTNAIRLEVDDGQATGLVDEIVEVIRASDAVRRLIDFIAKAELPQNRKRQLTEMLEEAAESFDEGERIEGTHSLQAFRKKVQSAVADPSLAQILTDAARLIINSQITPPRLLRCSRGEQGLRFEFKCESGWDYTLQTSFNLLDWTTETGVIAMDGAIEIVVPNTADFSRRFYRLVPQQN